MRLSSFSIDVLVVWWLCVRPCDAAPSHRHPVSIASPERRGAADDASTSFSGSPLKKRATSKPVFAHVVQGVFQNYQQQDYADDFAMAKLAGIDAFAMNVGHDTTDPAQMEKAFAAAEAGDFKLFFSFDMVYFGKAGGTDWILNDYLGKYGKHHAHYLYNNKVFVSTFSGEISGRWLNDAGSFDAANQAWTALFKQSGLDIFYAPNWNDDSLVSQNVWGGAAFHWFGWPTKGDKADMSLNYDTKFRTAATAAKVSLMSPVGAFFQVHQVPDNNYIFNSNNFLMPRHYQDLIENLSPGADFIELLSWNDFGEAHYLGPTRANYGPPTGSEGYANDKFNHVPMLWLSGYYNSWFKTGGAPTIKIDSIVWYYRPHLTAATASDSTALAKPEFAELMEDVVYVVVFTPSDSKAAKVTVTIGSATTEKEVAAGVNLIPVPLTVGETSITLSDSSGTVLLTGKGDAIEGSPTVYNYNYHCYILPEDTDSSKMFDMGTAGSGANTNDPGSGNTNSTTTNGQNGTTTEVSPVQGGGGTTTKGGATGTGGTGPTAITTGTSKQAGATGTTGSGTGSTGGTGSTSGSSGDSTSTDSSASGLNSDWMGLKVYWWIVIFLAVPLAIALGYMLWSRSQAKKADPAAAVKEKKDDKDKDKKKKKEHSSDDSDSSDGGGSGDSSDGGGSSSDESDDAMLKK